MVTLKEAREAAKITQRQLAGRIGASQPDITKWERGFYPPSHAKRARICEALGIDDCYIDWSAPQASETDEPTGPTEVYLVEGRSGEYDGARRWAVAAYLDEQQAERHQALMNDWCQAHAVSMHTAVVADWATRDTIVNPYDRHFYCDFTGTEYVVVTVPLAVSAPNEEEAKQAA